MTKYLSAEEILVIHAIVVDQTGGSHGVKNTTLLASLVERPKTVFNSEEMYSDIESKAAALTEAIVNYHVFVDENKRTAFVSLARFLYLNSFELIATNKEVEEVVVAIAEKKLKEPALAEWIRTHISSLEK